MMKEIPKISIVIPVHNGESYLTECLQSIYAQTFLDFEIIIVDDASTDRSKAIVDQFQDTDYCLRYFRNQKNLGAGGSRNVGIREARAELVAFLDADDRWYSTYLETQLRILDDNPDIDCLFSDFDFIDESGNVTDVGTGRYSCEDATPPISRLTIGDIWAGQGPMPMPMCTIFKKSALFDVGLFPDGYCEDINLWLRFSVRHLFAETGQILASYRKHNTQKTADRYQFLLGKTNAYQDAVHAYPEIRQLVGSKRFTEVMHQLTLTSGNYWFWIKNDYDCAFGYLFQAYRYKPSDIYTLLKLVWCLTPQTIRNFLRKVKAAIP